MRDLLKSLAKMIEDTIIESEDEPHFTTREHADTGAEEIYRYLIMPVLADAWEEGQIDGQINAHEHRAHKKMQNPYQQEQDA